MVRSMLRTGNVRTSDLKMLTTRYQDAGKREAASDVVAAIGDVDEAQRLAGKLDPSANNKATEALDALKLAASR